MFAEASASLSALAAYSMAAAGNATTSETQKAMAPRTTLEYLILKEYAGFELDRNLVANERMEKSSYTLGPCGLAEICREIRLSRHGHLILDRDMNYLNQRHLSWYCFSRDTQGTSLRHLGLKLW